MAQCHLVRSNFEDTMVLLDRGQCLLASLLVAVDRGHDLDRVDGGPLELSILASYEKKYPDLSCGIEPYLLKEVLDAGLRAHG
jgi:hypothetical protein